LITSTIAKILLLLLGDCAEFALRSTTSSYRLRIHCAKAAETLERVAMNINSAVERLLIVQHASVCRYHVVLWFSLDSGAISYVGKLLNKIRKP
jgi:hypothetical protein